MATDIVMKTPIETNELSRKAMGGTEMMLNGLRERLDPNLWNSVQIICSRVREIDTNRPSILWCHDLWNDPEAVKLKSEEFRNQFARLVFVSNWQFNQYQTGLGVPYHRSAILKNAIVPFEHSEKQKLTELNGKINLIYHTTPHRGLEILVPVVTELVKYHPYIHLDVYSSFTMYGPEWESRNQPYQQLFDAIEKHPNMSYHGYQSNDVVREALKKAHIFAFPSIWPETSCIAAIEAMSAGAVIVCPDYAALPETLGAYPVSYRWDENKNIHANRFINALDRAISTLRHLNLDNRLKGQKEFCDYEYNWDTRVQQWTQLIQQVLQEEQISAKK